MYYVAVEAERFTPSGEIGRFRFPRNDGGEDTTSTAGSRLICGRAVVV